MRSLVRMNAGFAFFVCLAVMGYMALSLYMQSQLRGIIPGVRIHTYTVTQKAMQQSYSWRHSNVYWVSWTAKDVRISSDERVQIAGDKWARLQVGDPITIAYVSFDNHTPYIRNDIFDSDGNMLLDIGIFIGALAVSIWMLKVIFSYKPKPVPLWEQR